MRNIGKASMWPVALTFVITGVRASDLMIDFEKDAAGIAWIAETTQKGGTPADWARRVDRQAPSPRHVLTITRINDSSPGTFNIHWTRDVVFENGTLDVRVRANTGEMDQGGGLIWRARDARNYYLARYNPLESNLRVYVVRNGSRRQLASAENISIPAGRWFQLRIAHTGSRITAWLDGSRRLQLNDETFLTPGGVGLWAKADAASSFDNLIVKTFNRGKATYDRSGGQDP